MKKWIAILAAVMLTSGLFTTQVSFAQDDDTLAKEEQAAEPVKDRPEWEQVLKTQNNLTDAQIQTMKDKGLTYPHMAMASSLASKSGKPLDDVLKMRTEDKMGWGKIAKELGVHPGEIGKSVSSMRHAIKAEKHADKAEKHAEKAEKHAQKAAEKAEKREAKRAARAEKANSNKKNR